MNTAAPAAALAEPDLITLQDFLRRFSISKSTFYRLASRGEAPPVAKLGRATFVPLAAARIWLQTRVVSAMTLCQSAGAALPDPTRDRPGRPIPSAPGEQ
jgi:predicted DNA-binding transcriptional regulator AlpA